MPDRDPSRPSDFDDWFAGLGDEAPPNVTRGHDVETQAVTAEDTGADDDWLHGEPARARAEPGRSIGGQGPTVKLGTLVAVAAVVLVLILAGLFVGGVFSGSGKSGASGPTTTPSVSTSQTPSTTLTTPARPTVPAPATTLKPGDQGAQVKRLQRALAQLGYSAGAVDGDYGTSTEAALTRFQKASKLTADGVLGPATLKALKQALQKQR